MPMGVTGLSELRLPAGRHAFPLSGNAFNPKRERQQAGILLNRRRARHLCPLAQQKGVPHDLRLLLDAVALERPAGLQGVAVAAEGMAGQRQPDPALMLPDQIGRASGRARVCQYVEISVVAVSLTQKEQQQTKYNYNDNQKK